LTTHEYTLLIVESSIVADQIRQLQIPWLEVIPTDGFIWKPNYHYNSENLTAIADPQKKELRRKLKNKSGWASKIVIATDNDPAGDFIAWSIMKFLPDKKIHRSFLQLLSTDSIQSQIKNAFALEPDELKHKLEIRYLFQKVWSQKFPYISPDTAVLVHTFHHLFISKEYQDVNGNLYNAVDYSNNESRVKTNFPVTYHGHEYYLFKPASTYDIIYKSARTGESDVRKISQNLFQLFTHQVVSEYVHLINYPRTAANFYFHSTWKHVEKFVYQEATDLTIKPESVREYSPVNESHESIRPLHMSATPDKVRHLLPSGLFPIYKTIFNSFIQSITIQKLPIFYEDQTSSAFILTGQRRLQKPGKLVQLRPCITIATLGRIMDRSGVTRPSGFARQLHGWINRGYVINEKGLLKQGNKLPRFNSRIGASIEFLSKSQTYIRTVSFDGLKQLFGKH
jgi:DNA topoisomerase IA